jgi:hypothetical protein
MRSDTDRYFSRDKYHPSDDGYRIWADAVLEELRPALVFDPPVGRALQGVPGPRSGEEMTRADR